MVRSLDRAALTKAMTGWLAAPPRDLRSALTEWAEAEGVELA
jgi:phosphotransferase system enzyme I (PtsP)